MNLHPADPVALAVEERQCMGVLPACSVSIPLVFTWSSKAGTGWWNGRCRARAGRVSGDSSEPSLPTCLTALYLCNNCKRPERCLFPSQLQGLRLSLGILPALIDLC